MQKHVGERLPDAQRLPSTWDKAKPHLEFVFGDGTSVNVNELLQNKNREIGDEEIFHRAGDVEIETDAIVFYARACSHIVDPREMHPGKISLRCGNAAYKWVVLLPQMAKKHDVTSRRHQSRPVKIGIVELDLPHQALFRCGGIAN